MSTTYAITDTGTGALLRTHTVASGDTLSGVSADETAWEVQSGVDVFALAPRAKGMDLHVVSGATEPLAGTDFEARTTRTLAQNQALALDVIDTAAGKLRMVWITEVPGQQAVYILKLQQARDYKAAIVSNPSATVPPYVAAEARVNGTSAEDAADSIDTLGSFWADVVSPAIEEARLIGKRDVAAITEGGDVHAAARAVWAVVADTVAAYAQIQEDYS